MIVPALFMKYLLNYLTALDKLLEKSGYFWEQHVICMKKGHFIEAEMWEKKHTGVNRVLQTFAKKMERELWTPSPHQTN